MFRLRRYIYLGIIPLLLACSLPGMVQDTELPKVRSALQAMIVVAPEDATATATPFQPMPPTSTYLPTLFPTPTSPATPTPVPTEPPSIREGEAKTWNDYPGPVIWPDIIMPPPVGILPQPANQLNILVLGSDQRPYTGGFRTDTILLVTINPDTGGVNITSFPRDLYVYIPGWTVHKINTAFGNGGFESLALTMEYNFGVRPDYYLLINFWSFVEFIDHLGGLHVNVGRDFCDHRDDYGDYCVHMGDTYMDGETALWYVRARYSTSDFDRGRRQQEVLQAGFDKFLNLNWLTRVPDLYETYRENVETNISLDVILPMLPVALKVKDSGEINHYYIGTKQVQPWLNTYGSQVLIPIREAVLEVMEQALNTP